jgi:alkylation response protein AidB-like acyl-CoA dehydrogenase
MEHLTATTLTPAAAPVMTGQQMLDTMATFAPEISERAAEGEALKTMPRDLSDRMLDAGLFKLALPRSLGGFELDPMSVVEVVEEASRADGSAGWSTFIANSTCFFSWLEPAVASEMVAATGDFIASSSFGPTGRAVPDGEGGYIVEGRWPFSSGSVNATWHSLGVFVMDGDRPRLRPDGDPDWRFAFVHHDDVEIIETWDPLGLRGTASHDIAVTGVRLPADRVVVAPLFTPALQDGPLWRLSFFTVLAALMTGFPLGVGRRALDEITALAPTKKRVNSQTPIGDDTHFQIQLSQAEAQLRGARALFLDAVSAVWHDALRGRDATEEENALVQVAMQQSMAAGLAAVDLAYANAGGSAVYEGDPVQRCFRDLHTARQHVAFSSGGWKPFATVRIGSATV